MVIKETRELACSTCTAHFIVWAVEGRVKKQMENLHGSVVVIYFGVRTEYEHFMLEWIEYYYLTL